ncbi:hypothetical protein MNB_SV-6-104 [hydrothermal vent metagenome]|uniref:Uncharacterized protein n=1 Tax=hydrothermal vent metagenome TaxID=652676 RepID=A0A1W1BKM5_9ZZZZ
MDIVAIKPFSRSRSGYNDAFRFATFIIVTRPLTTHYLRIIGSGASAPPNG